MRGDKTRIYADSDVFHTLEGNFIMVLEPQAAVDICKSAYDRGQLVSRIEGGIWSGGRFQPVGDCIWDGAYPPINDEGARSNNAEASTMRAKSTTPLSLQQCRFPTKSCNAPAVSAQVRPPKRTSQRGSSCPAPGAGAGGCRTGSNRRPPGWRVAGFRTGGGGRTVPSTCG